MNGIYKITNNINNKVYIGQSTNIRLRHNNHISSLRRNAHHNNFLQNAFNKYGESNFSFDIVAKNVKESELDFLEKIFINMYNSLDEKYGYNLIEGGITNRHFTEQHKQKISEKLTGRTFSKEHRENLSRSMKGVNHPNYGKKRPEHAEKMRKRMLTHNNPMKGKKHSEEARKKMSKSRSGENNPNYGKTISEDVRLKMSYAKNKTGYYRVSKHKSEKTKQGFSWRYSYYDENKKLKEIKSVDIKKLEKKVKEKGLLWRRL